ncbi:hypothetical protein PMAYCL1PPCAC_10711 [Pristionchus mayeri]|uniref:acid phosphatase n=1 Tax=Pristionchus mayeri TaxID=1317129 RepID=A0AAN4ZGQ9_9BILA|nr:hypothetical protein PMAYCL1PPCAC_10711 [Pristionchus mayeri]
MTRSIVLLLAVVTSVAGKAAPKKDDDELQLVQVLIRHGDRAATDQFATEKSGEVLFRGLGELSDDGIDHAFAQGKQFRDRYVDDLKFIDGRYIPSEVRFRASPVSRVLMSAGAFSTGLFGNTPKGHPVIPPIYTKDYADDSLLATAFDCTNGWDDIVKALNLSSSENVASTSLAAMENVMWPDTCKGVPSTKVDAIIAELPNKLIDMPKEYNKCAKDPAKRFMYEYIALLGGAGIHYNEERLNRTVGMLTDELLTNMDKKAACSLNSTCDMGSSEKFRVYYAHDVNVLALAHVFKTIDMFEGMTPAFSSALIFELWKKKDGHHVKVFLKNGQDAEFKESGFSKEYSTLEAVKTVGSKYAINEKMQCNH